MGSEDKTMVAAVWGAGWVSTEHLKAWDKNPHTEVVAIGSRTRASCEKRLAEAELADVPITTDLDEILARDDVDVVSVCLPANIQAEAAMKAAEAGKHVLVEKPIAKTLDELREALIPPGERAVIRSSAAGRHG